MNTPGKATVAFVAFSALCGALVQLLPVSLRDGALLGLIGGLVSGLMAMGWTARSVEKGPNSALLAMAGGFLIRMMLVPLVLLGARALGADMLAATGGFFVLYLLGQALEISLMGARRAQEQA